LEVKCQSRAPATWVKDHPGLGYWVRNQHELLLIAARGNMRSPSEGTRPSSVITAPRREHSRKPDEAYALIETMYPGLPKIELFARQTRPGWSAWGNELCVRGSRIRFTAVSDGTTENAGLAWNGPILGHVVLLLGKWGRGLQSAHRKRE
jgi:hypothetical protein